MDQMDMAITPQKIVEQNELQINLLKTFEFTWYLWDIRYTNIDGHLWRVKY